MYAPHRSVYRLKGTCSWKIMFCKKDSIHRILRKKIKEKKVADMFGRHRPDIPLWCPMSLSYLHDRHQQSMSAIYRPNIPPFLFEFWPLIRMPCSSCFHANHSFTRARHFKYILKTGTPLPIFRLKRPTLYLYWCRMIEEEAKDKTSRQ